MIKCIVEIRSSENYFPQVFFSEVYCQKLFTKKHILGAISKIKEHSNTIQNVRK